MERNLNLIPVPNVDNYPYERMVHAQSRNASVQVYFDSLETKLIEHIRQSSCNQVFGCVAWLTNPNILAALSDISCQIVVQKEDFLRPDIYGGADWKSQLRDMYNYVCCKMIKQSFPGIGGVLSLCGDTHVDGIRCAGVLTSNRSNPQSRMHHKFLVFCKNEIEPYAVWTGSFNFTGNSTNSFENAVFIHDTKIANAYLQEYLHVFALSEPLDWESEWINPEYRIGT